MVGVQSVMRVSRLKMLGYEKQKIIRNLVTLKNFFTVDDDFQDLSLQRKIFSQRILNDIMKNDSLSLNYGMELV